MGYDKFIQARKLVKAKPKKLTVQVLRMTLASA